MKPVTAVAQADACAPVAAAVDAAALDATRKTLVDMIGLGETVEARLRYTHCEYQAALQRKDGLVASGRKLRGELGDYQAQVGVWQTAYAKLNEHLSDYYQRCVGEPVDELQYQACTQQSAELDCERKALDELSRPLQQQSPELSAATATYAAEVQAAQQDYERRRQEDTEAMASHARWLSQAYQLTVSPEFAPYAERNGCPEIASVPQDAETLLSLGAGMLDCFRKTGGAGTIAP